MKRKFNLKLVTTAGFTALALMASACNVLGVPDSRPVDTSAGMNYPGQETQAAPSAEPTQTMAPAVPTQTASPAATETLAPSQTPTLVPTEAPTAIPTTDPNTAIGQVLDYSAEQLLTVRGAINFPPLMPEGYELKEGVMPPVVVAQDGQSCLWNDAYYVINGDPLGVAPGTYEVSCGKYAIDPGTTWEATIFIGGWAYTEGKFGGLAYHSVYDGMMWNEATPGQNQPEGVALWGPTSGLTMTVDYGSTFNDGLIKSGRSAELVPWTMLDISITNTGDTRAYFGKGPWGKASGNGVNAPEVQPNWDELNKFYQTHNLALPVRGGNGLSDTALYPGYSETALAHSDITIQPWQAMNGDTCWNVFKTLAGDEFTEVVDVMSCYWGAEAKPGAVYSGTAQYQSALVKSPTLDALRVFDAVAAMVYDWTSGKALEGLMIEASIPLTVAYEGSDGTVSPVCTGNSIQVVNDVKIHWAFDNSATTTTPAHIEQRAFGGERGNKPECTVDSKMAADTAASFETIAQNRPEGAAAVTDLGAPVVP